MNPFRRSGCLRAMALVLGASFFCTAASAQVLEQLPDDTIVVVKIKNIQSVSNKVAALAQQFGATQAAPELNDPLGSIINESGLSQGIDKNGDVAIVMPNSDWNAHDPLALVLVPITNYQQFLANFTDDKKEGELDVVKMKGEPRDMYVADWGKYAAIAQDKGAIKKGTGLKVAGPVGKELGARDMTVYVNLKALSPKVLPLLTQNKGKFIDEMTAQMHQMPGLNAKFAPVMQAFLMQYVAVIEATLRDGQSAAFGVNLSNDGISTSLMAEFSPGSYAANLVQGLKNTEASMTAGLPDNKYILYGGVSMDGPALAKAFDDFLAPIMTELSKLGDDAKEANSFAGVVHDMISNETGYSVGVIAPTGALGQSSLFQTVGVITTGNAHKLVDAQKKGLELESALFQSMGGANGRKLSLVYSPDAKKIDDVSFGQFQMKFDLGAQPTPEDLQSQQIMNMMYGPNGISGFTGIVDEHHLLTTMGVDDDVIAAAVKTIKANDDPVGKWPQLQAVNKNLPQARLAAFYFSVDTLVTTAGDYARKMGMPLPPFNLKPNLPPLACTISAEGTTIRSDGYISADLVSNLVSTIMQAMMQHGGPAGPGGPGGL